MSRPFGSKPRPISKKFWYVSYSCKLADGTMGFGACSISTEKKHFQPKEIKRAIIRDITEHNVKNIIIIFFTEISEECFNKEKEDE